MYSVCVLYSCIDIFSRVRLLRRELWTGPGHYMPELDTLKWSVYTIHSTCTCIHLTKTVTCMHPISLVLIKRFKLLCVCCVSSYIVCVFVYMYMSNVSYMYMYNTNVCIHVYMYCYVTYTEPSVTSGWIAGSSRH